MRTLMLKLLAPLGQLCLDQMALALYPHDYWVWERRFFWIVRHQLRLCIELAATPSRSAL